MQSVDHEHANACRPRPWFVSLTAIWDDDKEAYDGLIQALNSFDAPIPYPYHQVEVHQLARHLTAFAIMRTNESPCPSLSSFEFAAEVFTLPTAEPGLSDNLRSQFCDHLRLKAYEIRSYDDATAVQPSNSGHLLSLRSAVRAILSDAVPRLIARFADRLIDSMPGHCTKSRGDHAFGSIWWSPLPSDLSIERWRGPFDAPIHFAFRNIHLLTSDEGLTNPRIVGEYDLIIGR